MVDFDDFFFFKCSKIIFFFHSKKKRRESEVSELVFVCVIETSIVVVVVVVVVVKDKTARWCLDGLRWILYSKRTRPIFEDPKWNESQRTFNTHLVCVCVWIRWTNSVYWWLFGWVLFLVQYITERFSRKRSNIRKKIFLRIRNKTKTQRNKKLRTNGTVWSRQTNSSGLFNKYTHERFVYVCVGSQDDYWLLLLLWVLKITLYVCFVEWKRERERERGSFNLYLNFSLLTIFSGKKLRSFARTYGRITSVFFNQEKKFGL